MVVTVAGDIKGIETLAGQAGASATFNCVICEARLHQTYVAGVPHLRVLPEPWASKDTRAQEIIDPPMRGGTAEMAEHAQATFIVRLSNVATITPTSHPQSSARLALGDARPPPSCTSRPSSPQQTHPS